MDFSFDETQQAVSESAAAVFGGLVSDERVAEVEKTADRFDERLWGELAKANLLGIPIPEENGGAGLDLISTCLVLEQQGKTVAPIPLWPTLVLGAMPIAKWGTDAQRSELLPGVASGDIKLSAALNEVGAFRTAVPSILAIQDGDSYVLSGTSYGVPQGHLAARIIVPARLNGGLVVAIVDPSGERARLERAETTCTSMGSV
jgi:alkylation response protein AidB-like acyl-CoA dehydrogenase